jgi:hypothetical protein
MFARGTVIMIVKDIKSLCDFSIAIYACAQILGHPWIDSIIQDKYWMIQTCL